MPRSPKSSPTVRFFTKIFVTIFVTEYSKFPLSSSLLCLRLSQILKAENNMTQEWWRLIIFEIDIVKLSWQI
jgi:hypothetical protein